MAIPPDHPRVYVVSRETALRGNSFGVRGTVFVVREDQVTAATLDVDTGAQLTQHNC